MKLFRKRQVGVTKHYALKAALYRRLAKKMGGTHSFTKSDLLEVFIYESTGVGSRTMPAMSKSNGFAYGKWLRDIDCSTMVEAGGSINQQLETLPWNREAAATQ